MFFDNFVAGGHDLRFIDDYWEMADLSSFAKEHLGMMDAIIASRGRVFAGTYFSTFSGYITRLRGYYGMSKYNSYYSWNPVKYEIQKGSFSSSENTFKREYAIGWVGIDGDVRRGKDNEVDVETNSAVVKAADGKEQQRNQEAHHDSNKQQPLWLEKLPETRNFIHNQKAANDARQEVKANSDTKELVVAQDQTMKETVEENSKTNQLNRPAKLDAAKKSLPAHGIRSLEEGMIVGLGFLPNEDEKLEVADDGTTFYIVFSTDCGSFQHWQSYLLFFSAVRIRQSGFITRIASGCTDEQKQKEREWHYQHIAVMSSRFRLFFTPKFSDVKDEQGETTGKDYKYFNKPFGVRYYLENSSDFGWDEKAGKMTTVKDKAAVIILDPDMVLLRPLTTDFSGSSVQFWSPFHKKIERKKKMESGTPFGQTYGLSHNWMKFIPLAGPDSLALNVDERTADLHYQVGPPYIATALDMHKIVRRWAELVPTVYKAKPELMSEMYSYCLAAADQGLPHEVVNTMMISAADAYGEGWQLIDSIPDNEVCLSGITPNHHSHPLPTVMHYCQNYGVGDVVFTKHLMPGDIFECTKPLLKEPSPENAMSPENAFRMLVRSNKKEELKPKLHKRHVFVTCAMTSIVNEASLFFKLHHCKDGANRERTLDLLK